MKFFLMAATLVLVTTRLGETGAQAMRQPCQVVAHTEFERIQRVMRDQDYVFNEEEKAIMKDIDSCLPNNDVCISGYNPRAEYKKVQGPRRNLWQAKSIQDRLPDSAKGPYVPDFVFIQFRDKSTPEGICIVALKRGAMAEPWNIEAWRVVGGTAVPMERFEHDPAHNLMYNQTPKTIVAGLVAGYRITMKKYPPEAPGKEKK